MSNTDKLREFIHRLGSYSARMDMENSLSDLTALISEHYYPKEFLLWTHSQDYWKFDMVKCVWIPDEPVAFQYEITTDELFNYWKENEQ